MFPLIETIRLEKREFLNLEYHARRMRNSRRVVFGVDREFDLGQLELPEGIGEGRYKYRLPYGRSLGAAAISSYRPRILSRLVVVEPDTFAYPHKFADRTRFDRLKRNAGISELEESDDILIVLGGLLTDTSYSNVAVAPLGCIS